MININLIRNKKGIKLTILSLVLIISTSSIIFLAFGDNNNIKRDSYKATNPNPGDGATGIALNP
ncbi:MAG: hypothetical protein KGD57_01075, partial [Candidatus Lokiarchaeota archaeon]|nr:hypothetical protein [Candidatus Lokiarchaeota archaeon]